MHLTTLATTLALSLATLSSAAPTKLGNIDCNFPGKPPAHAGDFYWAAQGQDPTAAIGLKSSVKLAAGPGFCTRVGCSNGAGIFVCNDTPKPQTVPQKMVSNYAYDIEAQCVPDIQAHPNQQTMYNGRQISPDGWRVVFHGDKCN